MCTYNGERFLREQLDSILSQTYPVAEIIIQDDCSTDGTLSILSEYKQKFLCIKISQNKENKGYNENFRSALYKAKGDFIAISDQDDIWTKDKIEALVTNIGDCFLIFSKSIQFNELIQYNTIQYNTTTPIPNVALEEVAFRNKISGHSMLVKKELLQTIQYWDTRYFYDWWLAIAATYLDKVVFLDKALVYFRRHENAATHQMIRHKEPILHKIMRINKFLDDRKNYLQSLSCFFDDFNDNRHKEFRKIIRLASSSNPFKIFLACCYILRLKEIYYPKQKISIGEWVQLFLKPVKCWA
jgi:glycosyltransferase involved in cell wall biosynthesis